MHADSDSDGEAVDMEDFVESGMLEDAATVDVSSKKSTSAGHRKTFITQESQYFLSVLEKEVGGHKRPFFYINTLKQCCLEKNWCFGQFTL